MRIATLRPVFTPTQAAALTGLPLKAVNKAIEDGTVPAKTIREGKTRKRYVPYRGLICLQLEAEGLRKLPRSVRRDMFRTVFSCFRERQVRYEAALVIDVYGARKKMLSRLLDFRRAKRMIVSDREILGGVPVFKGTRVPVHTVAEMVNGGVPHQEILESYPSLSAEMLRVGLLYASAFPRRGRPPSRPWAKKKPRKRTLSKLASGSANAISRR